MDNNSDRILEVLGKEGGIVEGHFNADVIKESDREIQIDRIGRGLSLQIPEKPESDLEDEIEQEEKQQRLNRLQKEYRIYETLKDNEADFHAFLSWWSAKKKMNPNDFVSFYRCVNENAKQKAFVQWWRTVKLAK